MKKTIFYLLILTVLIQSCGITGTISEFKLEIAKPQSNPISSVNSVSISFNPERMDLFSVGVYKWGRFIQTDADVLKTSLINTISTYNSSDNNLTKLKLYINIRNNCMACSNNKAASISCVAWALVNNNNIVYEEQFYASDKTKGITTLGAFKNKMNKSIINRIANTVKCITYNTKSELDTFKVNNIYFDFPEAISGLPSELISEHVLTTNTTIYTTTYTGRVGWAFYEEKEPIDWTPIIKK